MTEIPPNNNNLQIICKYIHIHTNQQDATLFPNKVYIN